MAWSATDAVKHAEDNAFATSQKKCAGYVKKALVAGGLAAIDCVHARSCGGGLEAQGFTMVMDQNTDTGTYEKGDVVVIESFADPDGDGKLKGSASGHMAIWNGSIWISDFKQSKDVYPGAGYRMAKPAYKVYRNSGK